MRDMPGEGASLPSAVTRPDDSIEHPQQWRANYD